MAKFRFLSFFYSNKAFLIYWLIVFLASFFILFAHSIKFLDPDFGWHIRIGKDIIQTGNVPTIETYTFPTSGDSWVDHEWLSNYFLYKIYSSGTYGYWILGGISALIITLTSLIVVILTKKVILPRADPWKFFFFGSLLQYFNIYALLNSFGIRLQILSWFFTIILCGIFLLSHLYKKYWLLLFVPLLMLLWANLHGTFFLGLFCITIFSLFSVFAAKKPLKVKMLYLVSWIISILITLATPYKTKLWKLVLEDYTQNRGYLMQIKEWLPMYAAPYIEWFSGLFISFFVALFLIGVLSKVIKINKTSLFCFVFVFGMLALSIQSRRFLPFFVFLSYPISLFILLRIFPDVIIKKWINIFLVVLFFSVIPFKIQYIKTVPFDLFRQNIDSSPYSALLFLQSHHEFRELNLYNPYGWGGYLDWMWPEKQIFIDGRMPQKPLANGNTYLEEYFTLRQEDTMREKFEEYDIKFVLIPPSRPHKKAGKIERHILENFFLVDLDEFNKEEPIYSFLRENWKEVYSDNTAIVYLHPSVELQ
ncbi:MAG: hypothetical protein U9M90_03900 [Patescibacteria group bacterium]|nr:hypothetical protein [Patescibacteria group bacterium]